MRSGPSQADLRRIDGQNILLITIDTLRADALSAYGGPAATPALNLARDGRRDVARPYLDQFLRTAPPALYPDQLREISRLMQSLR